MTEQQFNSPGFVYVYSDLNTGKVYCGSHKGTIDDGYTHSSKVMAPEMQARPDSFVREIVYEGIWGFAVNLEVAINKQLIKDIDTTYNRGAGKTIVNEIQPSGFSGKTHTTDARERIRSAHLGDKNPAKRPEVKAKFTGKHNGNFKGVTVATNIKTGITKTFEGNSELVKFGFQPPNVYKCLSGERKSHRGYTFAREEL